MDEFKFEMPSTTELSTVKPVNNSSCATIEQLSLEDARSAIANSSIPVIVKFFAPWCAACTDTHPAIQEASCAYRSDARFISVNVDEAEVLAEEHGVDSLPTVAVFKGGKQGERREGSGSVVDFNTFFKGLVGK